MIAHALLAEPDCIVYFSSPRFNPDAVHLDMQTMSALHRYCSSSFFSIPINLAGVVVYLHRCVHLHFIVAFSDQMAMADSNLVAALLRQSGFRLSPVLERVSLPPHFSPPPPPPPPLIFPPRCQRTEPSGGVCHRCSEGWWLVKLESWRRHFVTVIKVEQVMLYLSLVMDHIFVLFSNSLPGAEEPPCSVTLIR